MNVILQPFHKILNFTISYKVNISTTDYTLASQGPCATHTPHMPHYGPALDSRVEQQSAGKLSPARRQRETFCTL